MSRSHASVPEELLRHARIVGELGARTPGAYLAETPDGTKVVLETYAEPVGDVARRLCGLRHPHLITVLSVERTSSVWSIATELVDGVPLEQVFYGLSLGGRLRAVVDVLTALSALHVADGGAPIVHRGVLLDASFVDKSGRTKLGFAYRGTGGQAPEVLPSAALDVRTDVYGAGVLLWEAVTGRPLFGDASPAQILERQRAGRVEKALPKASDRWARCLLPVIERALATEPSNRYATIAEMAGALRIAVRARLMFHDDIAEEIWPADTVPRHSSGAQPAAQPTSEMRVSSPGHRDPKCVEPSDAPVQRDIPPVSAPVALPRLGWWMIGAGIVALAILVAALVAVVHAQRHASVINAPPSAAPTPDVDTPVTTAPTHDEAPAPAAAPQQPAPHKAIKRAPPKSPGTFDPTTI